MTVMCWFINNTTTAYIHSIDVFQNKNEKLISHIFTRIFTYRIPGECEKETFIAQSIVLKELEIQMGSKLCFVPFFISSFMIPIFFRQLCQE